VLSDDFLCFRKTLTAVHMGRYGKVDDGHKLVHNTIIRTVTTVKKCYSRNDTKCYPYDVILNLPEFFYGKNTLLFNKT